MSAAALSDVMNVEVRLLDIVLDLFIILFCHLPYLKQWLGVCQFIHVNALVTTKGSEKTQVLRTFKRVRITILLLDKLT